MAMPRMIVNSIPDSLGGADLAERSIAINLPSIPPEKRKPERAFWAQFGVALPRILGALYSAVSVGLRNADSVQSDLYPRMADFFAWVEACAPALGWSSTDFADAYRENRSRQVEIGIEADPVAGAVRDLMKLRDESWQGTATELLQELEPYVTQKTLSSKNWPTSSSSLGARLARAAPALREHFGITISHRHSGRRMITIFATPLPEAQRAQENHDVEEDVIPLKL